MAQTEPVYRTEDLRYNRPLPGENVKAYALFEAFRDAGKDRVLTRQETYEGATAKGKGQKASIRWIKTLATRYRWNDRVAIYDAVLAERRTAAREEADVSDDLDGYRSRQKRIGAQLAEAAIRTLDIANERLLTINPATLSVRDVPTFLRAAAAAFEAGANAEAQAIGLRELLGLLDEQENRANTPPASGLGTSPATGQA